MSKDRRSIREKIQSQMEVEDRKRKAELFRRRLELARDGAKAFRLGDYGASLGFFTSYLRILEEWKDVPEGALGPEHFDRRKDRAELLLISGIYWDLTKIYDRSPNSTADFRKFLQKYVQFSRGMDFERMAAENLRKYVYHNKPVHKQDFKNAYESMTGNKCFVVGSLIDVLPGEDLVTFRAFRDRILTPVMPRIVRFYYRNGPAWAVWMNRRTDRFRRSFATGLSALAKALRYALGE